MSPQCRRPAAVRLLCAISYQGGFASAAPTARAGCARAVGLGAVSACGAARVAARAIAHRRGRAWLAGPPCPAVCRGGTAAVGACGAWPPGCPPLGCCGAWPPGCPPLGCCGAWPPGCPPLGCCGAWPPGCPPLGGCGAWPPRPPRLGGCGDPPSIRAPLAGWPALGRGGAARPALRCAPATPDVLGAGAPSPRSRTLPLSGCWRRRERRMRSSKRSRITCLPRIDRPPGYDGSVRSSLTSLNVTYYGLPVRVRNTRPIYPRAGHRSR
jgi:hypothetical protein